MELVYKSAIHILERDTNFSLEFLRDLIKVFNSQSSLLVYSEIPLPGDIKYTEVDDALEETYFLPIEFRFFFSKIPKKKLNCMTSMNEIFKGESKEYLSKLSSVIESNKWLRYRLLRDLDLKRSLSSVFIAPKLSSGLHSLLTDFIRKGIHSRAHLLEDSSYQFNSSYSNIKYADILVAYNYIHPALFELGLPVILYLDKIDTLKELKSTQIFYLLKTGLIQKVYTPLPKIRTFFEESRVTCDLFTNTDVCVSEFCLYSASLYRAFNPGYVPNIKADHIFVDETGNSVTIPSDLSSSYSEDQLVDYKYSKKSSKASSEESWKYDTITESVSLLGTEKVVYIGSNYTFCSYLEDLGKSVVHVFASETEDAPENSLSLDNLEEVKQYNQCHVICDQIFDNDDYFSSLSFLWLLKELGFKGISISFVRRNNLFLQGNKLSRFIENLGFKMNCNGFESEVPDNTVSVINLISD